LKKREQHKLPGRKGGKVKEKKEEVLEQAVGAVSWGGSNWKRSVEFGKRRRLAFPTFRAAKRSTGSFIGTMKKDLREDETEQQK